MSSLLLLNYRAGSTALRLYLGQGGLYHRNQQTLKIEKLSDGKIDNFSLPVINGTYCRHVTTPMDLVESAVNWSFVGDWWGNQPVPEPNETTSPCSWAIEHIQDVDQIAYLIRDGRNQVASLLGLKGGIEESKLQKEGERYFRELTLGFRNRARVALEAQKQHPGFRIFKFEELMANRVDVTAAILEHLGEVANRKQIANNVAGVEASAVKKAHSSFEKQANYNNRWSSWSDERKLFFERFCGSELKELGYESTC